MPFSAEVLNRLVLSAINATATCVEANICVHKYWKLFNIIGIVYCVK